MKIIDADSFIKEECSRCNKVCKVCEDHSEEKCSDCDGRCVCDFIIDIEEYSTAIGVKEAAEIVLNKLMEIRMFCGSYDTNHVDKKYMLGVQSVMESIALMVSDERHCQFDNIFINNLIESEDKAV